MLFSLAAGGVYWSIGQVVAELDQNIFFVFLPRHRHELFADAFQEKLARFYRDSRLGQRPVPPVQLDLAAILQAYVRCADDAVIEATQMDHRWALVRDCWNAEYPPFSEGILFSFWQWLIAHALNRRLLERTIEVAAQAGGCGSRALRTTLDSSPLWRAARVEDAHTCWGTPCGRRWT